MIRNCGSFLCNPRRAVSTEELANKLGVSAQAVSKWENQISAPDISLLPSISEVFGLTIDELFDLSIAQKLERIESKLDIEEELSNQEFAEIESFLKTQLNENVEPRKTNYLLAYLYTHRLRSDSKKISKYGRQAIRLDPARRENTQWMIGKAEEAYCWDWDVNNHTGTIDFYKEVVEKNPDVAEPYHYLIWNLIADHRAKEATHYLEKLKKLKPDAVIITEAYRAAIALARYDEKEADQIMADLGKEHGDDWRYQFEIAQYHTKKGQYEKAIECYETSFANDEKRPRFIDALLSIATIYEIQGETEKEIETYDRILALLKDEWKLRDDEATILEMLEKKNALLNRKRK